MLGIAWIITAAFILAILPIPAPPLPDNSLIKVKEEREKVRLKLNIQKKKIMASAPITSWKIDGETMETVRDFIFLGFTITVDGDCSHEIKWHLLLGRKVMTNLDSVLKSRDIKDLYSQSYGFSNSHVRTWELDRN